jgi:hypothetical protein
MMDPSHADSREYKRQVIDAEIKPIEESILALKRRRNSLTPISFLSTKDLTAIFSFLRVSGLSPSDLLHEKPDPLAWLCVAHVCHHWREIVLNQTFFWSHVDFATVSLAGAAEMLTRARMAPLYLEARVPLGHWDDARFTAFQDELQAHISHICHLGITAGYLQLCKTLERLVSPAPTLEYLSLCSEEHRERGVFVPNTLFDGITPRLSRLELRNCDFSWKSPLLKGLKNLEIRKPTDARPSLSLWLDALDEMPQLSTLTLHSASPIAPPFPFDVERTVTLPSLTNFDISDFPGGCALALAHLDLPALAWLCLEVISRRSNGADVQEVLPYVTRHAHGPQDTQPLQSVLIRGKKTRTTILAWPVPDIEGENPHILLAKTLPIRVALSFTSTYWYSFDTHIEVLGMAMAALPLDGLVTLTSQHLKVNLDEQFWLRHSPKWTLLHRMRLALIAVPRFIDLLLADQGGRENPLLPSLTELVIIGGRVLPHWTRFLCDALTKRMEQGVPLVMLDLRACSPYSDNPTEDVRLLSEIGVKVLAPDDRADMIYMWDPIARGPFVEKDNSDEEED